mmetsp:Transcript_35445/g.87096  ORF Transcript_35445/g.87096 Transcript_35445/m.87096 type:complete len:327 (-) Transcript_35445:769-1749(-)
MVPLRAYPGWRATIGPVVCNSVSRYRCSTFINPSIHSNPFPAISSHPRGCSIGRLGRVPGRPLGPRLGPRRVGLILPVITVVREAEALAGGRLGLLGDFAPLILVGGAVQRGVVPHDEVEALAGEDVVRAVAVRPQMHHTLPPHVLVHRAQLAVGGTAQDAAEGEPGSREPRLAQAHVEGDVAVVRVHVQPQVFSQLVLDDEGVVAVQAAAAMRRKQSLGHGAHDLPLQPVDHWLEADLVDDESVVVHAVGAPHGEAAALEVFRLGDEGVAVLVGEQRKGEHARSHLLAQLRGGGGGENHGRCCCTLRGRGGGGGGGGGGGHHGSA